MSESINRAFMYGESVFTTMRMIDGHLSDWDSHFERLKKGVEFVYGPFTDGDDWPIRFKNRLEERTESENGDRVIRLTIYREQAPGLLRTGLASIGELKIHLLSTHFDPIQADGKMFKLRICAVPLRPHWWPDYLKSGNYLETILTQKRFMKDDDDDVLFLGPGDTVLESSVANIFVVRNNKLFTAPTGPNVLQGIMRKKVIKEANNFFESFRESETTVEQLFKADAIFGTNAVRGPFLIDRVDEYQIQYTQTFLANFEALRRKVLA